MVDISRLRVGRLNWDRAFVQLKCLVASKKSNSVLGRIARSFSYRSKDVLLRLYRIYVRPILEYAVQCTGLEPMACQGQ